MIFSCIVPAYNEGPRIKAVVLSLLASESLHEVIVVDDGSTDETKEILASISHPKLRVILLTKNGGKTRAVFRGIEESVGDYLVFIDADLLGFRSEFITDLITPLTLGIAQVTFSLRTNSLPLYRWLGVDFVSGERVIPRSIMDDVDWYINGPKFGLESKMNIKILERGLIMKSVNLPIITPRKSHKMGFLRGTIADLRMTYDIVKLLGLREIIRQNRIFSKMQKG